MKIFSPLPILLLLVLFVQGCYGSGSSTKSREEEEMESLDKNPSAIKVQMKGYLSEDLVSLDKLTKKIKNEKISSINPDLKIKVNNLKKIISKNIQNLEASGNGNLLYSNLTAQKIYYSAIIQSEIDRNKKLSATLKNSLKILKDNKKNFNQINKGSDLVRLPAAVTKPKIINELNQKIPEIDQSVNSLSKKLASLNKEDGGFMETKKVTEKIKSGFEQEITEKIKFIKSQLALTPDSLKKRQLQKELNTLEILVNQSKLMSVIDWNTLREYIIGSWKNTKNKFDNLYNSSNGLPDNVYLSLISINRK